MSLPIPRYINSRFCRGFTLAELLISLAVLGVIATFAIPKVLDSQQDQKREAVMKETYAAMAEIYYLGGLTGEKIVGVDLSSYTLSKLNIIRSCPNNSLTEGCWTHAADLNGSGGACADKRINAGFTLANGATVAGFSDAFDDGAFWIQIDWNGPEGPNILADDQFYLNMASQAANRKPGEIWAAPCSPESKVAFDAIFD